MVFSRPSAVKDWEKLLHFFGLFSKMNRSRSRPWRERSRKSEEMSQSLLFFLSLSFAICVFAGIPRTSYMPANPISFTRSARSLIPDRSIIFPRYWPTRDCWAKRDLMIFFRSPSTVKRSLLRELSDISFFFHSQSIIVKNTRLRRDMLRHF